MAPVKVIPSAPKITTAWPSTPIYVPVFDSVQE